MLGPTGLNFAAGMSGGIAYVFDEDGGFRGRCNTELVGFDAITPDESEELRGWVDEHRERTGSTVAARLLDDWQARSTRSSRSCRTTTSARSPSSSPPRARPRWPPRPGPPPRRATPEAI